MEIIKNKAILKSVDLSFLMAEKMKRPLCVNFT